MKSKPVNSIETVNPTELRPGIQRKTLVYNSDNMLCHFHLEKGARLELHSHKAAQLGYVLSGKVEFIKEDGTSFIAVSGTAYIFQPWEKHGTIVHEDTDFIECFSPARPEYTDEGKEAP